MAIKGGDLIHVGNSVLIDRIQTAGPGQVNIPTEKIYELGNYKSVGSVLDTPDLTFSLESLDASAEIEAMLCGSDFATDPVGTEYDLSRSLPLDAISQFKAGRNADSPYNVLGSVAVPFLTLESMSYRFGIRDNASQSASLRGDSIYWNPGSSFVETTPGDGTPGQIINLASTAYPYAGDDVTRYTLAVSLVSGRRLRYGIDYTETVTGTGAAKTVDITITDAVAVSDAVRVVYTSDVVATYPQESHEIDSATRPAAIRGRNIDVFIGGLAPANQWSGIQSLNAEWRVQLDKDEELGSSVVIAQDFDVPTVSGSIDIKPTGPEDLMAKIRAITGVSSTTEAIGALQRTPLALTVYLKSPTDGSVLKTLHVPDARFTVPGYSGRVQQKMTLTMNWESDSGSLSVFKGLWD